MIGGPCLVGSQVVRTEKTREQFWIKGFCLSICFIFSIALEGHNASTSGVICIVHDYIICCFLLVAMFVIILLCLLLPAICVAVSLSLSCCFFIVVVFCVGMLCSFSLLLLYYCTSVFLLLLLLVVMFCLSLMLLILLFLLLFVSCLTRFYLF